MRFPEQAGADASQVTSTVVETFLAGAKTAFLAQPGAEVTEAEARIDPLRRPFFWEGHALGIAARHSLAMASGHPVGRYRAPGFRFMLYTGIGFWNGVAGGYRLPTVSLDEDRWQGVDDFEGCRPLIAGGHSFAVATIQGHIDHERIRGLDRDIGWWRHGLYQGVGRAAWFLYMRRPERLARCLEEAGDDAMALAEGLGIAITYTQLTEPERILPALRALPERWFDSARAGSQLCLGAAAADDPRIADQLAGLPGLLPDWLRAGQRALHHAGHGPDMAPRLSDALYGRA